MIKNWLGKISKNWIFDRFLKGSNSENCLRELDFLKALRQIKIQKNFWKFFQIEPVLSAYLEWITSHPFLFLCREGSTYLHRSMSTNATVCRNIHNITPPNNNNKLTNSQTNLHDSEWKHQEEISLMSLEKDLRTLDESVNQINIRNKSKFSKLFDFSLFKKKRNHNNNPSKLWK